MKYYEDALVINQEKLADGVYSLWLENENIAREAKAGQFISLYSRDASRLLPRPISICEVDAKNKAIRMVYRKVGRGTAEFSQYSQNDKVKIMGPLGNGFTLHSGSAMLIAGGIGIPPMLQLAKELEKSGVSRIISVLGYRDSQTFLADELAKHSEVYLASEDGSVGTKGNVLDAIRAFDLKTENIYACGPKPMLRAVKEFGLGENIRTQISMEEKMACGIGACLACVCASTETDSHSHVKNKRICADGPVFYAQEVEL